MAIFFFLKKTFRTFGISLSHPLRCEHNTCVLFKGPVTFCHSVEMCMYAHWRACFHALALWWFYKGWFYKGFREAPHAVRNTYDHLLLGEGLVIYCPSAVEGLPTPPTPGDLTACPEMPSPANVSLQASCNFPTELFSKWPEKVEWELLKRRINVSLTLAGGRKKEPDRQKRVQESKRETAFISNLHFSGCPQRFDTPHLSFSRFSKPLISLFSTDTEFLL